MSQLNIMGLVASIKDTTVYTALVEALNNSIYSIEISGRNDGEITVELLREKSTLPLAVDGESEDASTPDITSVRVRDNGIGFNEKNLKSFDEAYTRNKVDVGGKGFGRFVYLRHFTDVRVSSVYADESGLLRRTFELGKIHDIVYNLQDLEIQDATSTETVVELSQIREGNGRLDKKIETVARKLLEKILVQFVRSDFKCPTVKIVDEWSGKTLVLNDMLNDSKYAEIQQVGNEAFTLHSKKKKYDFTIHIFKVWFPGSQHSRISLASHYLEVSDALLGDYINEFESGFAGEFENGSGDHSNRYILKVYVVGDYLDQHVDRERVSFRFGKQADGIYPIGRADIESKAADLVRDRFKHHFSTERGKKLEKVENVTSDKPWLKRYESALDLTQLKVNSSEEDFEVALEMVRIRKDRELSITAESLIKSDARKLTDEKTEDLIHHITQSNKDDLARYVARRKAVLDIFVKSMEYGDNGKHAAEKVVHDIIYPMQADSDNVAQDYSNLWLLDERLNFTEFISSDKQMGDGNIDRTDLFIFHHQVAFRAGDEKQNPITIVEFKKPGRDDFTSRTDKYNPITQIIRYTNEIRDGKYKTPVGRPIHTDKDTQFYGYIVVDFTDKVKKWLSEEENFTPMPDGLGYYKWLDQISLYVEVLSWDKVLKDAQLRNRIFSEKLGLH